MVKDFMANLSYNDETRNYIFSHGSYEDGGFAGATGGIIGAIKVSELGGSLVDYFYSFGE